MASRAASSLPSSVLSSFQLGLTSASYGGKNGPCFQFQSQKRQTLKGLPLKHFSVIFYKINPQPEPPAHEPGLNIPGDYEFELECSALYDR